MHVFKSDGRYKLHSQGFQYIMSFRWGGHDDPKLFIKCTTILEELYGPMKDSHWDDDGHYHHNLNTVYRYEQVKKARRRRIYLKNESDVTLILLRTQT